MAINKVKYGDTTLIDLTGTTATADKILTGYGAYGRDGVWMDGSATGGGVESVTQDENGYVVLDDESGTLITVDPLSVTQNGTYTAPTGHAYSPVSVNVSGGGGYTTLKTGVIRPDAELVQRWSADELLVEDLGLSIPAYTTSATSLKGTTNLTPTIPMTSDYRYFVLVRTLSIPIYSTTTKSNARQDYQSTIYASEISEVDSSDYTSLDGTGTTTTDVVINTGTTRYTNVYWTSSTKYTISISGSSYGACQKSVSISIMNSNIRITSPAYYLQGSTYCMNATNWNYLTDIRYQWIVEIYRVPKDNMNVDGWEQTSTVYNIFNDIKVNNGTLT